MRLLAAAGFVLLCAIACRGEDAQPGVPSEEKEILLSDSEAATLLEQAKLYLNEATAPYAYMAEVLLSEIVRRFPTSPEAAVAKSLLEERGVAAEPDKEAGTSGPRVFGIPLDSIVNPLGLADDETPSDCAEPQIKREGQESLWDMASSMGTLLPESLVHGMLPYPKRNETLPGKPELWRPDNPLHRSPRGPSGPMPPFFETPPMEREFKRRPFQEGDPFWNLVPEGSL